MIHPSYVELMKVASEGVVIGEEPVVNSRYSIVLATAKRARQIIDGAEPMIDRPKCPKPLSIAVEELYKQDVHILSEDEIEQMSKEYDEKLKQKEKAASEKKTAAKENGAAESKAEEADEDDADENGASEELPEEASEQADAE